MDPETGTPTFAVVQAEDELAALGMVLGAGWAGARAMTTTSGPGISLMSEFAGLGYYAEIPAVIFDVQRVGPSTGPSDADDAGRHHPRPTTSPTATRGTSCCSRRAVQECYEMAMEAFDLAERFQTPVFVMSDLDLGMNNWMADPFPYSDKPFDRGKVLRTNEELDAHVAEFKEFARYQDVDGDGIPWRTLPGIIDHPLAAYFTRGSGHNDAGDVHRAARRLQEQHGPARAQVRDREALRARVRSSRTARARASASSPTAPRTSPSRRPACCSGSKGSRPTTCGCARSPSRRRPPLSWPSHDRVYVVDQNRDGQMYDLLRTRDRRRQSRSFVSIRHYDGFPLDAETVDRGDRGRGEDLMSTAGRAQGRPPPTASA